MKVLVLLTAIAASLWGMMAIGNAQSAVHEIEALICGVIVMLAMVGGMITNAIEAKAKIETKTETK